MSLILSIKTVADWASRTWVIVGLFCGLCSMQALATAKVPLTQQPETQQFIERMVKHHHFSQEYLVELFNHAQIQSSILTAIANPKEGKPWYLYRENFLTPEKVKRGRAFWQANQATLQKAEREYGVPANVIVAILGVETDYGRHQGKYRVIDALSTLAFAYPPRSPFFTKELEDYLLLTRENQIDPLSIHGSYAGAIGQPQFMPSTYRHYAVAYNGGRSKDLQHNTQDVIVSVANYLQKHGWQRGQLIAVPAQVTGEPKLTATPARLEPNHTISALKNLGIQPEGVRLSSHQKALFFGVTMAHGSEYWLGLQNFYAITRYNPRINYAMAVFQLSQMLEQPA